MKNKTKILLIVGIVIAVLLIGTVSVSYALTSILTLEYDYITEAETPLVEVKNGKVVSDGEVKATIFDIIYNDGGELKVECNLETGDEGYTIPANIVNKIVRILPVRTVYEKKDEDNNVTDTIIVNYKNEYIYSFKDLEKANAQKAYNNIFEYIDRNSQSKSNISRILCFMKDLTVEKDFTVNYPCSVEFLTSSVTLNGDFTIAHSYAGSYYIRKETDGELIENENIFSIKAPKALYVCYGDGLTVTNTVTAEELLNGLTVTNTVTAEELLNEAICFAGESIPKYPTKNLILQPRYKTYGITLEYTINDKVIDASSPEDEEFDGRINDIRGLEKSVTVTAKYKGETKTEKFDLFPVDFANGTFVIDALIYATEKAYNEVDNKYSIGLNLSAIIKEIFGDSIPDNKYLSVFLTDDSELLLSDINASSLSGSGVLFDEENNFEYINVSGDISGFSLSVDKGFINMASTISLYFLYGTGKVSDLPQDPSINLSLKKADYDEIIYYLKDKTPAFITNKEYGVLNVNVKTDGIFAGDGEKNRLTNTNFGITSIVGEFYGVNLTNNSKLTDENIKDMYFGEMAANHTYTLKNKTTIISINHSVFFKYTVTFGEGENKVVKEFSIPVYRAVLGSGGESEMFTSDNQLASYFINEDMNWLVPLDLELSSAFYTLIEITHINGVECSDIPADDSIKDIVAFRGDAAQSTEVTDSSRNFDDERFYQVYKLLVNPNYIPSENTSVTVHCYLFNSDTESDTKINEYDYTFIIPGILKCESNEYYSDWDHSKDITPYTFTDEGFYSLITEMFQENAPMFTSMVYRGPNSTETVPIVLSTAKNYEGNKIIDLNVKATFDSNNILDGKGNAGWTDNGTTYKAMVFPDGKSIANVDGIEVFGRIQAIVLDGVEITNNIYAFEKYRGLTLKYLSMKGCSLNDSKIYKNNESVLSNLYILTINLADNSITEANGLLMRTVSNLDISNNGISDINGIASLTDLLWLDISENKISRFEILKKFEFLKCVFVTGQRDISGSIYGTKGGINIPVYVWIMKTNESELYADSGNTAVPCGNGKIYGYDLSADEIDGSLVLNALALPTVLNDAQKIILQNNMNGLGGSGSITADYTFKFLSKNGTESSVMYFYDDNDTDSSDFSSLTNGNMYYYKIAVYKESVCLTQREFHFTKN